MTQEQAIELLKKCNTGDIESDHSNADDVLCNLLIALGYDAVVQAWEDVEKWYA